MAAGFFDPTFMRKIKKIIGRVLIYKALNSIRKKAVSQYALTIQLDGTNIFVFHNINYQLIY